MIYWTALAGVSLGIWIYLLLLRGGFWREGVQPIAAEPERWPRVVAVVPARNEAEDVGAAIGSLLRQDYPGDFSVILVDDHSSDGTAEAARAAAIEAKAGDRIAVLRARDLPQGWTGKLWALGEGIAEAEGRNPPPELILLTDADIVHHASNLRELVARIAAGVDLASLMVRLRMESTAERFLVPAFVFFFEMLYPFAYIRDPRNRTAGAAGGCVLIRREALRRIGGIGAIRGEIIDDCALARAVKRGGPIWLGLSTETRSLRAYPALEDIWRMVARTAYAQLRYSPLLLLATVLGMVLTFLAPVVVACSGTEAAWLGTTAWAAMALAYLPTLRLYEQSPAWAPLLPLIALVYIAATVDSARRHWLGRGGEWKGRTHAGSPAA
ncbi:MAG TPA: glycosyltransferase [Stellaceae bacterium]|nr:glycosyltransferase [Stellaceae bacterium]